MFSIPEAVKHSRVSQKIKEVKSIEGVWNTCQKLSHQWLGSLIAASSVKASKKDACKRDVIIAENFQGFKTYYSKGELDQRKVQVTQLGGPTRRDCS